jgi:hypothetical protein
MAQLAALRRITAAVPAEVPDRLVRVAMLMCTGCDMDEQFNLGLDLMLHGMQAAPA